MLALKSALESSIKPERISPTPKRGFPDSSVSRNKPGLNSYKAEAL